MATRPIARRHHYLPQAYLAAFTASGRKDGQFCVLDVRNGHSFRTSPINVANEKDFNRIDVDGQTFDALEVALAPFEAQAVDAIRRVIETQAFPTDDDWNWILNLLGLIAVRNPAMRESFNTARSQVLNRVADLLVSDKHIWDHHVARARHAGQEIQETVTYEQVKQFVEARKYEIDFLPEGNLRVEFSAFDELLPILGERTWSVLVAPDDGPEFICCDHPVTLVSKRGAPGPLGYGLRDTEVFFPLGRRVGFYGVFEAPLKTVVVCQPGHVATMNKRLVEGAERHVYSALPHFSIWHRGVVRSVDLHGVA
jgi:hypothetical protein